MNTGKAEAFKINKFKSSFRGKYFFLSNFYNSPMYFEGTYYLNAESAYQSCKLKNIYMRRVFSFLTPSQAKEQGRNLIIRDDWEDVKVQYMYRIIREKFKDKTLRMKLLLTGNEKLVEYNTWGDRFWGVYKGKGENMLGNILMRVRNEIRGEMIGSKRRKQN